MTPARGSSWHTARAASVIGAAHRRQAKPCQDASLCCELTSPTGQRLLLLAVADGHGGARYWLSHVGSALAVQQAKQAVEQALGETALEDTAGWRMQLQQGLPAAIQRGWREAIEADWQRQKTPERGGAFAAATYGSTLGLVLLTPHWWGVTGLGDWDLVGVDAQGQATLLSEEREAVAAGEATASLCLNNVVALCSQRAQLQVLDPGAAGAAEAPAALLLSTDGMRKSCATDLDFLSLATQLIGVNTAQELEQVLAQISAGGSGDDVSLAMATTTAKGAAESTRQAASKAKRSPRQLRLRLVLLLGGLLAAGFAALSSSGLLSGRLDRTPAQPSAAAVAALRAEQERLCRTPQLIRGSLLSRRSQLEALQRDPNQASAMLARGQQDPLGALIAAGMQGQRLACPPLQQALLQALQRPEAGRMTAPQQHGSAASR